ncbi:MAG TPA: hypothetical protein DCQ47_05235 [Gammaproteobacteria bacterium]|nr:hypothetical protein [Gammaproteobacteria bacterium]
MIWMVLLAGVLVFALSWALRHHGRQGFLIALFVGALALAGSGYLYWYLGSYEMALSTEALNSLPENERAYVIAQAAQDEFLLRNRVADQEIIGLFELALKLDPKQITALGSLGIIAFEEGNFQRSLDLWTRMLGQLQSGSAQAEAIKLGIVRARERLGQKTAEKLALGSAEIQLSVSLSQAIPESLKNATVFLFAKEVGGSPRPIVARRLSVNELPLTVTLSNHDALMGGQLHPGLTVEIMARLTVGDAAGSRGDWMGGPIILTLDRENRTSLQLKP